MRHEFCTEYFLYLRFALYIFDGNQRNHGVSSSNTNRAPSLNGYYSAKVRFLFFRNETTSTTLDGEKRNRRQRNRNGWTCSFVPSCRMPTSHACGRSASALRTNGKPFKDLIRLFSNRFSAVAAFAVAVIKTIRHPQWWMICEIVRYRTKTFRKRTYNASCGEIRRKNKL